ncbi:nucleoside 2-deoxyribosyltransferase [Paenibacillus illinoisensis]|uniref:nucleoside 2-deoxyribosyltransferase n=1 Tax=Paenibacillus illinoisensis TaxID=59845 RepID=UPI001C8DA174|nr:nucleoside 2-deoxyribosyltransferase [Paenibacillus illinoisensis]MBY0217833.1 nucleoside 2-deoxyribosyltransferase [Paenibacillus illinoisensis]
MPTNLKFLLIGEVYTDVHLQLTIELKNMLRLGGIFHSARAFHANKTDYSLAFISPSYLSNTICSWADQLHATACSQIGEIKESPNVILISDTVEAGDQGYNDLLRSQSNTELWKDELREIIEREAPTDILVYPGKYEFRELIPIFNVISCRLHLDLQYDNEDIISALDDINEIETFITSTSSTYFKDSCTGESAKLADIVNTGKAKSVLLKENRGGSRYYRESTWVASPAFQIETAHSVGVGDCFNALFISKYYQGSTSEIALRHASYSSAWYASTWEHEKFCDLMNYLPSDNEISDLKGTEIHWEERTNYHIYIAAPDFPDVDVSWIEKLYDSLKYHNFVPHRPVLENGLITGSEPDEQQLEAYNNDLLLLENCSILVAVLLNDDPGTYVEIGWMAAKGKPVILFDPNRSAKNLFLRKSVNKICYSLGEVIDSVFEYASEKKGW